MRKSNVGCAFVLTDDSNRAAMAFYASMGGVWVRADTVVFFFSF
jgi:hypothetical protein